MATLILWPNQYLVPALLLVSGFRITQGLCDPYEPQKMQMAAIPLAPIVYLKFSFLIPALIWEVTKLLPAKVLSPQDCNTLLP